MALKIAGCPAEKLQKATIECLLDWMKKEGVNSGGSIPLWSNRKGKTNIENDM